MIFKSGDDWKIVLDYIVISKLLHNSYFLPIFAPWHLMRAGTT